MPKFTGSHDVYRELVEESDDRWDYGLFAFAVIEEQRIEWMRHYEGQHGKLPTQDEIRHWYEQQPKEALIRAKGTAESALRLLADDVLQEILEIERREVLEGQIIEEIRQGKRFLPQFGVNVAGGLASALIFAAILIVVAIVVIQDLSPVSLLQVNPDAE